MLTYSDELEHAIDYLGGAPDNRAQASPRRAVVNAYQRLTTNAKQWRYYIVAGRVNLNGSYSTGTIEYTASSRTFAITGGSWPSWAIYGQIRIERNIYEVESVSGSNLVVTAANCPVANIASGTSYELFQSAYPVPSNYQDIYAVVGNSTWMQWYVDPETWFARQRLYTQTGAPWRWTILGEDNPYTYGKKVLVVDPSPSEDAPHVFLYRRTARALRYSGQETAATAGTISISGATVTGSGTSFNARMVGSVIRLTDSTTTAPTGLGGLEPYTEEAVIKTYSSSTSITLATTPSGTYSGTKYRISDPLDIDDCMISPMRRGVEFELQSIRNASDAALGRAQSLYNQELIKAWEIDQQSAISRAGIPLYDPMSMGYSLAQLPHTYTDG
jgi:hypothetical protein